LENALLILGQMWVTTLENGILKLGKKWLKTQLRMG